LDIQSIKRYRSRLNEKLLLEWKLYYFVSKKMDFPFGDTVDPETFFKRDHDRDEKNLSRGSRVD